MSHKAIDSVVRRVALARNDSDFVYFFDLLLAAETLAKTVTLGVLSALSDDSSRNRYRIAHSLSHADGLGAWAAAIEDMLTGHAAQFLITEAYPVQNELTKLSRDGDWQHAAVVSLREAIRALNIEAEEVPVRTDLKRWFRLLATLRNKTKAHGATRSGAVAEPADLLQKSIDVIIQNLSLLQMPWAYLHRNISGKYRVSPIAGDCSGFDYLKTSSTHTLQPGIYILWNTPRYVPLLESGPELTDFFYANGSFTQKSFELISYATDDRRNGDATPYLIPPGQLPSSETEGHGELFPRQNCFSNAPDSHADYISRSGLEAELLELLVDDRHPIITLRGRGGIGKTSLALKVIEQIYTQDRYVAVIWLSARDVDLQINGPKPVRANVVSPEEISQYYASLMLSSENLRAKDFNARIFFEAQLRKCDSGPCLFVFDNFETTQNPIEMFTWIDTFIRLPNKALLTTRLRDFKGDYPIEITGMTHDEADALIVQYAGRLGIRDLLAREYKEDLIHKSEGHPYVIKVLLGEVKKTSRAGSIPHLVAGSDEILAALFERTYSALPPCAQRAFLTLSAWNSSVPRVALEAVLFRSTGERSQVETGIDTLLNYSLAESFEAPQDGQEFISLPLVASIFGKKKLNINAQKLSIQSDVEILQMLGPSRQKDLNLGLARKLEGFVAAIAKQTESGASDEKFEPILEMICRNYPAGWLICADWYLEIATQENLRKAKDAIARFLETEPEGPRAAEAWRKLAFVCHRTGDALGEIHAFVERSQIFDVSFFDVSSTANRVNQMFGGDGANYDRLALAALAQQLLAVLDRRKHEANADDLSRMAWLAIHLNNESKAREYVETAMTLDSKSHHISKLATRLHISYGGQ